MGEQKDPKVGVDVEIYRDGLKPAVVALGQLFESAARTIADPLRQGLGRLRAAIMRRLGEVPPDRLLAPPATILAPTALHYALLGEGDEVAELRVGARA